MCMCVCMEACVYNISLMGDVSVSIIHLFIDGERLIDYEALTHKIMEPEKLHNPPRAN